MNLFFAWRYFRSKKSVNAINIIAWISVLAIAVGTASLIVVLSVFNGFEDLVKGLYGDFYSDVNITAAKGKFITVDASLQQKILQQPGVRKISFYAEEKAVLVNGDYQTIVYMKGVDANYNSTNNIVSHVERGSYDLGNTEAPLMIAGAGISNAVGADPENIFSQPVVYLPNRKASNFSGMDAMHSYGISTSGVFNIQQEFDDKYAFTNLPFMQYMLDIDSNTYSGIELALAPGTGMDEIKKDVQQMLGNTFLVKTRFQQNQGLFTAMQMEKWIIYAILSLILLVAAFNMIGALTMLVLEKQKDIAVLKAMGAPDKRIRNIFLTEGLLLACIGGVAGMLFAFLICQAQQQFKIIPLSGTTFIIDYYPVKMFLKDFLLVGFTVFTVAVIASWLPSRKAAAQLFSLKS